MPENDERYPGKVGDYRDLMEQANALLQPSGELNAEQYAAKQLVGATLMLAAMVAGNTQVLDKIAYNTRKS